MNLYSIIFGLIFLAAGAAFFAGLTPGWLNVWQRMSEREKSKIRIDRLSRNIGCVVGAASAVFLAAGFNPAFHHAAFMWCMIAWFILTGLDIVFINHSGWYKSE